MSHIKYRSDQTTFLSVTYNVILFKSLSNLCVEGNQFFWCVRCYNRITLYVTPDLPPALIFCVVRRSTQLGNELCGSCLPHLSIETSAIRHKLIPVSYARQPVWGYPKHRAIIMNGSRRLDGPPPLQSQHIYILDASDSISGLQS